MIPADNAREGSGREGEPEDRFDRFRRIEWWNQEKLRDAKVLVIGAGALGNEILKNLALLGIGSVFVADLDRIAESNLSRSILFRSADLDKPKAQVAAEAAASIYPDIRAQWFHGDVIYGLGLGVFDWADAVIGGLDNREARLYVCRACWKVNRPFLDGATEHLSGLVRVFVPPDGACYECTMSASDWELLKERRGCFGMQASGLPSAIIPTTPVTASVIAALQCQELVKLLHGFPSLAGHGLVFNGGSNEMYTFRMNRNEDCLSHERLDRVIPLNLATTRISGGELLRRATADLGAGAAINLGPRKLLVSLHCPFCGPTEEVFRPVGSLADDFALCPSCGKLRQAETCEALRGAEPFLDRPLSELGVPPFDIVSASKGDRMIGYQFWGDASAVLGRASSPRSAATTGVV
jgi:adenylyltransferase/sulfurtransferase